MGEDEECTHACRSRQHGSELGNAISCQLFSDAELFSYMTWRCSNFVNAIDAAGRSLAHIAAEAGRLDLLRHFLSRRDCLNEQDEESSYTLLHCSLLHGQLHCSVRLIQLGADVTLLDSEYLSPFIISMKDLKKSRTSAFTVSDDCEPYVWGTNANYTLGLGHNRERSQPEPHDFFRKSGLTVVQVGMQKFHTVFVCGDGSVWSCGHGAGGRLGQGSETASLEPKRVALPVSMKCIAVSLAEDHTILLTDIGLTWTCGLNPYKQLGINPPPVSLLAPKPIRSLSKIRGICASQYHSVFWNKSQVFTCGTNGGQLGHPSSEDVVVVPKEVGSLKLKGSKIINVSSSPAAIAVVDDVGAVYLISNYRCTKITPKGWILKSSKILVQGGSLQLKNSSSSGDFGEVKVVLLCIESIYLWRASSQSFLRCFYSIRRELLVTDMALITSGCVMSTTLGETFLCYYRDGKKDKKVEVMDVRPLPHVHRAASVSADPRGANIAVLQASPRFQLDLAPPVGDIRSLRDELALLLNETSEDDSIHDIVFKVGGRRYPAHRYIVFYANDNVCMKRLLEENKENEIPREIELPNIPCEAFQRVLSYMYGLSSDLIKRKSQNADSDSEDDSEEVSAYESYNKKTKDSKEVNDLRFVARRLGVIRLLKEIEGKKPGKSGLNRKAWKFDATLKSSDGNCIHVHRCILVARLDYFKVMLTHGWRESQETELSVPINGRILEALIEFLYTDDCADISECTDLDFLSLVLVAADELFCEGLKRLTEVALLNCLTLRNAVDLLQLATTYNAPYLLSSTELFICQNITAFLESRTLEILSDESLKRLSSLYREKIPHSRKLRTSLDAIDVATIKSIADAYPVTLELDAELAKPSVKTPTPKKKDRRERKTSERSRLISLDSVEETAPIPLTPLVPPPPPTTANETRTIQAKEESKTSHIVLARLKAINASQQSPPPVSELKSLTIKDEISLEKNFPELSKSTTEKNYHNSASKVSPSDLNKKFPKLSQRERRRLASLPPQEEETQIVPPKSPWAPIPAHGLTSPSSPGTAQLAAIIVSEKEDKERAARMRSKPLYLTQLEDRAIQELSVFYNTAGVTDERITVTRLQSSTPAPPIWVSSVPRQL